MKTENKVEAGLREKEDRVSYLRGQLDNINDDNLMLFADWVYNNHLATIAEYVEAKALIESTNYDL